MKSISADQRQTQSTSARFQFGSAPAVLLSNFPINPSAISDRGPISQAAARKLVVSCAARGVSWLRLSEKSAVRAAPEWILFWSLSAASMKARASFSNYSPCVGPAERRSLHLILVSNYPWQGILIAARRSSALAHCRSLRGGCSSPAPPCATGATVAAYATRATTATRGMHKLDLAKSQQQFFFKTQI